MKIFCLTWCMSVMIVAAASPSEKNVIKNGDFEKFAGDTPSGWESTNIPNMLTGVSASTNSHGGKHAVKCQVVDFYGTKMAGMLCLKDVPVSGNTLHLKGFYFLRSIGNDVGYLSIAFKNAQGAAIGSMEEFLNKATGQFVAFTGEAKLPDSAAKIDIHLTLLAGRDSGSLHEGSYVLFDDLALVVSSEETK